MSLEDEFVEDLDAKASGKKRTVTVGWTVRAQKGALIWQAPQAFSRNDPKSQSSKSVQYCPAAVDFDRRHFVISCPVDLTLHFEKTAQGLQLRDADGEQSGLRPNSIKELMILHPPSEWRDPNRPIIQFIAPYVFIADEPCYVVQTAPYLHYSKTPRPGVQIGGRFPVHVWPRPLSWGFEWHDYEKPLVMKRGEPWFYVHFETENPAARVRLIEQEMTPELEGYVDSIVDVSNYVNKTFSMFSEAQARRPQTLVCPRKK